MSQEIEREIGASDPELVKSTNEMLRDAGEHAAAERAEQEAWRAAHLQSYREAEARGEWVPDWARATTQKSAEAFAAKYGDNAIEFLRREREVILNAANPHGEIDPNYVDRHEAYLNGRKDAFNALREGLLIGSASLGENARDIPEAIEVDQIRVRQQQQELEIDDRQQVLEL